jgi:hypothetical protein
VKRVGLGLVLLLALGAGAGDARAETVEGSVREILRDGRYRFCHEDDYPLTPDEHAWCPIVGDTSALCPSLPKACKLPAVEGKMALRFGRWRGGGNVHGKRAGRTPGEGHAERAPVEDLRRRPEPETRLTVPDLSGLAQVVLILLLVAFVVVVGRAIAQNLLRERGGEKSKEDEAPPPEVPEGGPTGPRGPVETDVDRLLSRARAAAERGDYARAVDDAYAALLRRLDGDGIIEIHPSRTNGDYVRSLRDRPDLGGPVREVVREVEDVQFGATPATEPVFRAVLARVLPLVGKAIGLVVAFIGLSAALSCAPHGGGDPGGGDTSPSGTQAIIDVMARQGLKIRRRNEPLVEVSRPLALVVLPDAILDEEAWKHLLAWVNDKGGRLILAGTTGLPAEIQQRIVVDAETVTHLEPSVDWVAQEAISLPPGSAVAQADGKDVEGVVLHRAASPVLTERTFGEGRIVLVADERLFTNAALTPDDDASFLLGLLLRSAPAPEREIELVDGLTGAGARTPLESLQQARLTPFVIQLFVLMALLFLWKGRAFARLREPAAQVRRAFADHARALGLSYQRARASHHVTGLYAVWALDRLRERVHRGGRQGLIPLAEAIAARTGRPEGEIMSVLVEAVSARDEAAPPSSFRPSGRRPGAPAQRPKESPESDLALMRELMSFLAATGSPKPPTPRSS